MIQISRNILCLFILSGTIFLSCPAQDTQREAPQHNSSSERQDIVAKLKENSHLSVEKQITLYKQLKAANPDEYTFENEDQLTMYGYGYLWSDLPEDALQIFNLIAEEFPESANAYDSIGEAYYTLGKMDESLANYKKSLAMNPDNYNAEDYIDRILYPTKKQETPAELFDKVYSAQAYKDDLDDLGQKLIKTHPAVFKFTSEADFRKTIEDKKAQITDQTTYAEFSWYCNEIVANVNCSHTDVGGFFPENEMLPMTLRFPVQTVWIEGRLYISDALNNERLVSKADEILRINGIKVSDILKDIYRHIPSQGLVETTKRIFFNKWSTGLIAYALNFPNSYTLSINGKEKPITLNKATTYNDPLTNSPIVGCGEPLCLKYIDDDTAILSVFSFNFYRWNNYDKFVEYMDLSFLELKEKGIKNLIVDVRGNGGGSPESSIYLLQYLAKQPFTYFSDVEPINGGGVREPFEHAFQGNTYYLIDGRGNSTTGHFMAMVKEMKLGTIIGEELGSNQYCTAGQTIFKLTNTRLQFYSANSGNRVTVTSLPDEKGILPDQYVRQNITDYLNSVDVVLNYATNLIKK